jgi:hypothetical protein
MVTVSLEMLCGVQRSKDEGDMTDGQLQLPMKRVEELQRRIAHAHKSIDEYAKHYHSTEGSLQGEQRKSFACGNESKPAKLVNTSSPPPALTSSHDVFVYSPSDNRRHDALSSPSSLSVDEMCCEVCGSLSNVSVSCWILRGCLLRQISRYQSNIFQPA